MSDQPDNIVLIHLRRIEAKLDRLAEDLLDTKQRVTTLEVQLGSMAATEQSHYGAIMQRFDRIEARLVHIERRFDLVEPG